jgi:hypothetical protein
VGVLRESIPEWASPDFHMIAQQPFIWLLLGILAVVGFSRRRLDGSDFMIVAGFAYLTLLARRNFAPFALVAIPVFSRYLSSSLDGLRNRTGIFWGKMRKDGHNELPGRWTNFPKRILLGLNIMLIALALFAAIGKLVTVTKPRVVSKYSTQMFPVGAVDWVKANHPEGRIFNAYHWGGYLAWKLRDYPVFVDGRTDLYGDDLLDTYLRISSGDSGWENELDRYGVHLVLIEADSGLAMELAGSPNWNERFRNDLSVLFVRKD